MNTFILSELVKHLWVFFLLLKSKTTTLNTIDSNKILQLVGMFGIQMNLLGVAVNHIKSVIFMFTNDIMESINLVG